MSLPYPSSSVEQQNLTQRTRQSPPMLFSNDPSSSTQHVAYSHIQPITRPLPQEQLHPSSSSIDNFSLPSDPQPQVYPGFHTNNREEYHRRSPYDDSSVSSLSRTSHRSQTDYPTTTLANHHRMVSGISTSCSLRTGTPQINDDREEGSSTKGQQPKGVLSDVEGTHAHTRRGLSGLLNSPAEICDSTSSFISSHPGSRKKSPWASSSNLDSYSERPRPVINYMNEHSPYSRLCEPPVRLTAGMLPNRDYYPLPHHQHQFDALYMQDASIFQERESLGLNTLDCEFGQPPQHSMPVIIECAILGSPHQKLTLSELRLTLKRRFRHYEQEEEKGVKSWERTLLQNLSKKSRFTNTERSMSEPGQGGYWHVNHNAPPPNRARKRNTIKRLASPLRAGSSISPVDQTDCYATPTIDGPSSLFRSVPAEQLPGGRAYGMNERCIVLPELRWKKTEVFPSSPRRWRSIKYGLQD